LAKEEKAKLEEKKEGMLIEKVEKFDKSKHEGTRFDPELGIRVPVKTKDELPRPKTNAETIISM